MPRKKKIETRGRKPAIDTIRANWIDGGKYVRLSISDDLVAQLKTAHAAMFQAFYLNSFVRRETGYDPFKAIRIEVMRFDDITMPAVLVRIETPNFDPKGHRLWQAKTGKRWYVQFRAAELGLRDSMPATKLEYLFEPASPKLLGGGMVLLFPDECMIYEGKKNRAPLKRRQKAAA